MDIPNTEDLAAVESLANLISTTVISEEPLRIKGSIPASCAVSCLVKPRTGDQVLCVISSEGNAYLLAILERLEPEKETLIVSDAPFQVQAAHVTLISDHIELVSERVDCNIGTFKRVVKTVEDLVGNCMVSFGTFFMFAKRSMRRIEELDETRSGHLKLESPSLVEVSGAVTAISGDELISMQSKQIHMG